MLEQQYRAVTRLPGISGSFILVLLGMYKYILAAVSELRISVLLVFAAGAATGLIAFSNLLSWLLHKYHDLTIAALVGVMIGSLNKVWPWKQVVEWQIDRHGARVTALESNVWPWSYPDLPAADLATYATRVGADVVALSVLMTENMPKLIEEIGRLAQLLPAQVELWGGGNALYRAEAGRLPARLKLIEDLRAFEREITLLDARVTH